MAVRRRLLLLLLLHLLVIQDLYARRHERNITYDLPALEDQHALIFENTTPHLKEHGGWSQWSDWSLCSRTCDGGVSRQLRTCSSPEGCHGEPVRYRICNMQPCRANSSIMDEDIWREQQCIAHDSTPYGGELFHWRAHRDDDEPCALTCRGTPHHSQAGNPVDEDRVVVAVLSSTVLDGTRCRPGSLDMCIDGRCQRVGCDLRVGSTRRVDECGVCGGDGSSCSRPRYHWLATPGSLCSATCGGGYKMSLAVCRDRLTGTDASEQLCDDSSKPPANVIRCNMHPCPFKWYVSEWSICTSTCGGGIQTRRAVCARSNDSKADTYEPGIMSEPGCLSPEPPLTQPCNTQMCPTWITGAWSGCSVSCGEGVQVRGVKCSPGGGCDADSRPEVSKSCSTGINCPDYRTAEEDRDKDIVDEIADLLPGVIYHTQPLIQPYPPPQARAEKLIGDPDLPVEATYIRDEDWSPCSVTCGEGWRKKEVHCKIFLEFSRTIAKLPDNKCVGPKPIEETERCVMEPCSMAYGSSFGDSAQISYGGSSDRSLTFGNQQSGNIRVAPGSPGKSYSWKEKGYTSCSASCLSGVQELIIQCVRDEDGKNASPYMCDPLTKPENRVRTCNDHPCPPRWNYTEFSPCTKSCGIGIQTREVTCIHEVTRGGTNTVVVPNSMCPQPPPPDRQYCNVLDCPVRWQPNDWSKCSKTCGGGIKTRDVICKQVMAQSHVMERPASLCGAPKPASTKTCNTRPCLLDTASPEISLANSSYIQHDPKKKKVTVKVGGSATIFYGTQVKIKCPVKGYNRTRIQWAKDNQILTKSKKHKISKKGALRINSLSLRDHGVYTCLAGRSSANLTLVVKPRPGEFPSSEEIERQKISGEGSALSDSRADSRYIALSGGRSDDQSHEQRPGDQKKNHHRGKHKGKVDQVRDALYGNYATMSTRTSPIYEHQSRDIFQDNESTINSRGLRTVDSLVYNENSMNNPVKIINLDNKQILIPEDDDSDIIIVNEDATDENDSKSGDIDAIRARKEYAANVEKRKDTEDISVSENVAFEELGAESSNASYAVLVVASENATAFSWKLTDWSPCSICGRTGHQVRGAACQHKNSSSTTTVEVEECLVRGISAPRVVRECTVDCANWQTGNWSKPKCQKSGGNAIVRRKIFCVSATGNRLALSSCDPATLPAKTKRESTVCKAVWEVGPWSRCIGECNGPGRRHRSLRCVWDNGVSRKQSAGPHCENLARPRVVIGCKPACVAPGGVCRDSSRFCNNVRAMNLCALKRYKLKCCKTCFE